jgi:threonyl-tRNA synthetase
MVLKGLIRMLIDVHKLIGAMDRVKAPAFEFYYDFDLLGKTISQKELMEIEEKMRGAGARGYFRLTAVAGVYKDGDEKERQLQRVSGVVFGSEAGLDEYLERMGEGKERDHRRLGRELDLFCFSDLVGAGLPMFTPRGTVLREKLADYSMSLRAAAGFCKIWTPHITKVELYKKSGHWDKFGEELFLVRSQVNGDEFALKPMNCPHHTQIFASRPRTYREMPVRYMEVTTDYRDEKTGELGGLSRVRALTQDDSHAFCRKSQIKAEIAVLVGIVRRLYELVGMERLRARLSYRDDSGQYLGDVRLWGQAQRQIRQAAEENGLEYFEAEGEAAFYGPKIDFMASDAIGREHQVATVQLDFVMPERFGLEFVNEEGKMERPVMIHHATLGSIERFLSVFIEHTGGWFPFWCAPEQVRVVTVNDGVGDYVAEIGEILGGVVLDEPLKFNALRWSVDGRDESVGKKIREAVGMKVPVVVVVGPRDVEGRVVSLRVREGERTIGVGELAEFLRGL